MPLTYEEAQQHPEINIIINTTPAGMYPNNGSCLLDLHAFPKLEAVLDCVYNPFRTELLLRAEELGVPAYCGFEMLVAQAVYAAEHFTGQKLPEAVIADTHRKLKRDLSNVAIIGMPGCGKSTIGRALAKTLGKTYVDLDEVIEKNTGMPIPDIFAREGEASFRKYESQAVAEISKQTRQVIACGGGVIKTPATPAPCARTALCCGCNARSNGWQPAGGRFPPGWTPCARWKPSGCRFTAQRPMPRWITPAAWKTQ